jgi:5-methylcytosine-specific restriction endonuclease McrA
MKRTQLKRYTELKRQRWFRRKAPDKRDYQWARAVKQRDGYCCQRCGTTGTHAHHKISRARRPDVKYDIEAGITLCESCHRWTHANPKEANEAGLLDHSWQE